MKKTAKSIHRAGLVANPEKISSVPLLREAARLLEQHGVTALTDRPTRRIASLAAEALPDIPSLGRAADLLIVLGGDGTMLSMCRALSGSRTPILGVNIGGLGFLTAMPAAQLPELLPAVLRGEFAVETRSLIEVKGAASGQPINQTALNDFVISRGAASRLIELEVLVDDEVLTRYRCDGLILSSPTGSTAYSLAAGGAVVSPSAEVLTITPICPHTLSNRSVIVNSNSSVRVRVLSSKLEIFLTSDGQVQTPLAFGDEVVVRKSKHLVRLARLPGGSFFETLRQKLNWSGSNLRSSS